MAVRENYDDNKIINGTSSADSIVNTGDKVTINAGKGNDLIGNGNWTVIGGSYVDSKWEIRAGAKTSLFGGSNVSIDGGKGNDYIENSASNVSISGGSDNDFVANYGGSKVLISGDNGNDKILNDRLYPDYYRLTADLIKAPDNSTLLGGNGNDYIYNEGSNVSIDGGAGDDRIVNCYDNNINLENVTIDGGAGNDSVHNNGDSVTINTGAGNDSVYNDGDSVTIDTGAGNDTVYNSWSDSVTIDTGAGNDSVWNYEGDSVTIDTGAGNDSVWNYDSDSVTIDTGAGNDLIDIKKGSISNLSINGGEGNDSIQIYTDYFTNNTILGGKGNDLISVDSGANNLIQYAQGDGKDTIYGFNDDYSIQILTDSKIVANMNGNDAIFKIGDTKEAITLKDVLSSGSTQIKFLSKTGELSTYNFNKNTGTITNESDSITLTSTFSGTFDASNYANVDASNADNKITVTSGKTNSVTLIGGTADDSIENFTAKSSLVGGKGNDTIINKTSYNETVTRQVTETVRVQEPTGYDEYVPVTIKASARLPEIDKKIKEVKASIQEHLDKAAKYEEWARDGDTEWWLGQRDEETLAADNLQGILKDYQADYDAMLNKMLADGDYTLTTGETEKKFHQTGLEWVNKVETKNVTETLTHQTNNVGSTISGGAGNDYVINEADNFVYSYTVGDGNDSIEGFNANSTLSIAGGEYFTQASGDDVIIMVGKGKINLIGASSLSKLNIKGKKAKTSLTVTDKTSSPVKVEASIKTINASKRTTAVKITGNARDNSIRGGAGNDSLYGGTGNDSLYGNSGKDKLFGQAGDDYLSGGDSKDTLSGGSGDDKLLGGAGNDSLNGGSGKDTLSGGYDADYLFGGTGNDSLRGGKGNDTLWGGKDNDTLWGDEGKDTFIYVKGDGKDIIYGFDNGDTLTLDGLDFTASYSKKYDQVTFTFDNGSIKLKKFTATTFHIDNDTYKISGSKFVKQ